MVVKKAWIPSKGTYSVGTSDNPIDPTLGNLSISDVEPRKETEAEKQDPEVAPGRWGPMYSTLA